MATSPPTTIVETIAHELTGVLAALTNLQSSSTQVLKWRVPTGFSYKITSTSDTGTATFAILKHAHQVL